MATATQRKIIVYKRSILASAKLIVLDVVPVVRETKLYLFAGHDGQETHRITKPKNGYQYPNDSEIAAAESELAETRLNQRRTRKEQEAREAAKRADPRCDLLRRFGSGADFEPWHKLSLEELQTIADIFDSIRLDSLGGKACKK